MSHRCHSCRLALLVWICLPVVARANDKNLRIEEVLSCLEAAADAIVSYDVTIRFTNRWLLHSVPVAFEKRADGREFASAVEWCAWGPGEEPSAESQCYRQVFGKGGKRRFELLAEADLAPKAVQALDGEVERGVTFGDKRGFIFNRRHQMIPDGKDYLTYFRCIFAHVPLATVLRDRTGTRLADRDDARPECVVVESPPEQGSFAQFGLRAWLDPAVGFLPARIEYHRDAIGTPYLTMVVNEFREFEDGIWAPVDIVATYFNTEPGRPTSGHATQSIHGIVDVQRSRWNLQLSDETFVLAFPPGIKVFDETRQVTFVTGEGDTGKSLDRLLRDARHVVQTRAPGAASRHEPRPRSPIYMWVGGTLGIVIAVAVVAIIRRRRNARGTP